MSSKPLTQSEIAAIYAYLGSCLDYCDVSQDAEEIRTLRLRCRELNNNIE